MRRVHPLLIAAILVGGFSAETSAADAQPSKAASAAPASPGKSCVSIARIRESRVRDDQTIDFRMIDGTIYRNRLPHRCSGLGFERAFMYSTSLHQLCSTDIITVIHQGLPAGGPNLSPIRGVGPVIPRPWRGASCGLGLFVPYVPAADEKAK